MTDAKHCIEALNTVYTKDYFIALEMAYGTGFMSEGGTKAVDALCTGVDLQNKKILDFGCGIGGMAFHLADAYQADVVGLEINPEMVQFCKEKTPAHLAQHLEFIVADTSNTLPFADATFDVICSKGVITHIPTDAKPIIFKEFFRILKPGGKLIISDWLSLQDNVWDEYIEELATSEGLIMYGITPQTYKTMLENAQFNVDQMLDKTELYAKYNTEIAATLRNSESTHTFTEKYGKELLDAHVQGYVNIATAMSNKTLLCYEIQATRPF